MTSPRPAASILERLAAIPESAGVALIIRHAEREAIPSGAFGWDVGLTEQGIRSSERLGAALSKVRAVSAVSSPVHRCVQTAEALLRGSGSCAGVATDRRLGDPGPFVAVPEVAGPLFLEVPVHEIARRQLEEPAPPPGMRRTEDGVGILLDLLTANLDRNGRLCVYVTHDVILTLFIATLYEKSLDEIGWPGFLDGLLLWQWDKRLHFNWRGLQQASTYSDGSPAKQN